jgi:hypothetical protein
MLLCALVLHAQKTSIVPDTVPNPGTAEYELYEIDHGNWASISSFIELAGAANAIPILEARFETSQDTEVREHIAIELWRRGYTKLAYSELILRLAREAVDSPKPFNYGRDGKSFEVTPEFLTWAKAHNIPEKDVPEFGLYLVPGHIMLAAELLEPHSGEIFRHGLESPNDMIVVESAQALAKLQDVSALPLLIDLCAARPGLAPTIAFEALIYFDDSRAEAAARQYLAPNFLKIFGGGKLFAGKDPYHPQLPDVTQ